jgi:hypothetical protein
MSGVAPSVSFLMEPLFPRGLNPRGATGLLPIGFRGIIQIMTCAEMQCQTL